MSASELKPNKYYKVTYSVIPDNKIEQVQGTYQDVTYNERTNSTEQDKCKNVRRSTGASNYLQLPCFTSFELTTSTQYFTDEFYQLVTTYSENWTTVSRVGSRTEKILGDFVVDIYYGLPIKINEDESISVTNAEGTEYKRDLSNAPFTDMGWLWNGANEWASQYKVYSIANYNRSGPGSTKSTDSVSTTDIVSSSIDQYWDGSHLDPVSGQYLLRVTIKTVIFSADMAYDLTRTTSYMQGSGHDHYTLINKIEFSIPYLIRSTETVEFEHHVDVTGYTDYPLKITGNEYTNSDTTHRGTVWHKWISDEILDRYKDGKLFVSAKVKMAYVIENEIDINSEVKIKDINNHFIHRTILGRDYILTFLVKNIEYVCESDGYYANIVLLEHDSEPYENYVVNSNNIRVVTSNNVKLKIFKI